MSTLGLDRSGNGNDWIAVNKTIDDQVLDVPTNNFATLDPLWRAYFTDNYGYAALTNGLLQADASASVQQVQMYKSTFRMVGKVYFEIIPITAYYQIAGFGTFNWVGSSGLNDGASNAAEGVNWYVNNATEYFSYRQGGDQVDVGGNAAVIAAKARMQFAYDESTGKGWIGVNNVWYAADGGTDGDPAAGNNPTVTITAANRGDIFPAGSDYDNGTASGVVCNFGQDSSFAGNLTSQGFTDANGIGDFYYEPPAGFLAMCTKNLPEPAVDPRNHFNTVLYTGDGNDDRSITGVGFQPDFVWYKERSVVRYHGLFDILRGVTNILSSNVTDVEETISGVKSFTTDGFTLGTHVGGNEDGETFVAWNWKAGNANTAFTESGNNPGGIHRANVAAGFSIVSYVGTGAVGTVAHGLGAAPQLIYIKNRGVADEWYVYSGDNTDYMVLNDTDATADSAAAWNDTSPSSTVFTVGTSHSVNADAENYIAYCWRSIEGFSKVGSYTGTANTDGTFVHTGFRPAYLLVKPTAASNHHWWIHDTARNPINPSTKQLRTNSNEVEYDDATYTALDFLSNGFKWRTAEAQVNGAVNFIYVAFAETPFKYANAK